MKKIAPDPPRFKLIISPHFSAHSDMLPADSLALANEFLCGVVDTLDQQCQKAPDEADLNALTSAAHATRMARTLVKHALTKLHS
nr:hypothetical protein [uncultured Pseudomonas sp.]